MNQENLKEHAIKVLIQMINKGVEKGIYNEIELILINGSIPLVLKKEGLSPIPEGRADMLIVDEDEYGSSN